MKYPVTSPPISRKYGGVSGTKPKRSPRGVKVIAIPVMTTSILLMIRNLLGRLL
jgi:hypothetical protein